MSVRVIKCESCSRSLGEIRDARLRKNISYLCETCEIERRTLIELLNIDNSILRAAQQDSAYN